MNRPAPELLFENNAGRLEADPAGFLRTTWSNKRRTLGDTQGLFNAMLRGLQQRRWSRILVNQAQMGPFTPAEQQWVAADWLPRAVGEGGYRFGAVVVSPDSAGAAGHGLRDHQRAGPAAGVPHLRHRSPGHAVAGAAAGLTRPARVATR